jgi:hypothetical protein
MKAIKIGNAQGFWGDSPGAAARLLKQQPDLDYLTLDYLAELSMSILAIQKEKDPAGGYAKDFLDVIGSLIPFWKNGSKVKVVANAGGLNPQACAKACAELLKKHGLHLVIGTVTGDDVLDVLNEGPNLETGEPLSTIKDRLVTANAYLGAAPIAEALEKGADIVITGRVADPSLTVGPCMHHFKWKESDYDKIAGATIAGHLIECGTQVTGGISTKWLQIENPAAIGFPIVEVSEDGSCIVTKPLGTSGCVDEQTVKEQLLYEIGDPAHYLSPDATVSFLTLKLRVEGPNRVHLSDATGGPPPSTYKVSATYRDGFRAEGMIALFGRETLKKAQKCGEIVLQRVKEAGFDLQRSCVECLGGGDVVPGVFSNRKPDLLECVLRIAVADSRKEAVEYFTKEIAPLVTSGPQGITGYSSGRPHVRPVFGYWPCLIAREKVKPVVTLLNTHC